MKKARVMKSLPLTSFVVLSVTEEQNAGRAGPGIARLAQAVGVKDLNETRRWWDESRRAMSWEFRLPQKRQRIKRAGCCR